MKFPYLELKWLILNESQSDTLLCDPNRFINTSKKRNFFKTFQKKKIFVFLLCYFSSNSISISDSNENIFWSFFPYLVRRVSISAKTPFL